MAQLSKVRLIHSVVKGPSMDVYLDEKLVLSNLGSGKSSEYLKISPGQHTLETTLHNGLDRVSGVQFAASTGDNYDAIFGGDVSQPQTLGMIILRNDNSCPLRGQTHFRVVHTAIQVPALDIYLAKDGPGKLIFRDVRYGSTGTPMYIPLRADNYVIGFTLPQTRGLLSEPQNISLKDGQTYTLVISGNATDVRGILVKDSSDGLCYVGESQIRI